MTAEPENGQGFRRELGLVDASVVVAGSIIGVGIFANPSNVARILPEPSLILLAWGLGGGLALLGGLVYAELGARLPRVGGQYTYLTHAYHPVVGFLYGVALLFIINGGALAAVAIVFASYLDGAFVPLGPRGIRIAAALTLVVLTAVNARGVRAGKWTNNLLMAAKVGGILALMLLAFTWEAPERAAGPAAAVPTGPTLGLLLTALVPIMFAYGGWQNCGAVAGEIRNPARNLALANVLGVSLVVVLYLGLNLAYLRVLSPQEVAGSTALAADVARAAGGEAGARFVSALILVSSLGFLAVTVFTGPRLYYAMAADGLLFRRAAHLHPRHRTPVFGLWLQTGVALALLATNSYDELLSYVVFADWLFFSLTAAALFRFRRGEDAHTGFRAPGHPFTTGLFVLAGVGIVVNSFFAYPVQSVVGSGILAGAALVYFSVLARKEAP